MDCEKALELMSAELDGMCTAGVIASGEVSVRGMYGYT